MMELNLNCDLGEKSNHYNGHNDEELLKIVNTANIACGYHAGNKGIISKTIKIAKANRVSIGAHPGFKDKKNFGRKRLILSKLEIFKLVIKQLEIISEISKKINYPLTHVKPHGALNNMACEDFQIANTIGKAIKKFDNEVIFLYKKTKRNEPFIRFIKKISLHKINFNKNKLCFNKFNKLTSDYTKYINVKFSK